MSTALLTDHYELTMLDAARRSGHANRHSVFEVFSRKLPGGRRYGVVAGTGRLLDEIDQFRFGEEELEFLRERKIVSDGTLEWLANFSFSGSIRGYREGDLYFPHSPILQVEAPFAEAVLLETLILSVLNHDCAVATAASRMVQAAAGRPLIEMGSRRTSEHAAWASARAAAIVGFGHTSNLEAGRRFGLSTLGTAAHAFTLLHESETEAFESQLATLGTHTTLLIDTFDIERGVTRAIEVAGKDLGAVRIDSGDLRVVVNQVRAQLDALGAKNTRIVVTNELDEFTISALHSTPVDSYGVGTAVVSGSGQPSAGLVYKLVSREDANGQMVSVHKTSTGKHNTGGKKNAWRELEKGHAVAERIVVDGSTTPDGSRDLLIDLVTNGKRLSDLSPSQVVTEAAAHHTRAIAELPPSGYSLTPGDPAIPTVLGENYTEDHG
jgi:nicotinate phosphoribosyltransferase